MTTLRAATTVLALALVLGSSAQSRTWRVAADHSGDWWDLYTAVEAASDGDTLSIAPGRYDYFVSGIVEGAEVIAAWDQPKSLTFIGDHRDSVFVGPAVADPSISRIGLNYRGPTGVLQRFKSLTVENMTNCIGVWSDFELDDVLVRNSSSTAVSMWWADGGSIRNCTFSNISETALRLIDCDNIVIEDCLFNGVYTYIADGSNNCTIRRSMFNFMPSRPNVLAFYIADGRIEDCDFGGGLYLRAAPMELTGNRFVVPVGDYCVWDLGEGGGNVLTDNLFEGGEIATIIISGAEVEYAGSGNHIIRQPGAYAVALNGSTINTLVDLRGNYWGTTEEDSISAWIRDMHDEPSEDGEVLFRPFESEPVPTDKKSLGGLKAMFRDATR